MRLLTLVCVVSCIGGGWAKSKMAKREKEKNSKEFLVKAKSKKPSCSVDLKDLFSFDPCGLFDNNHGTLHGCNVIKRSLCTHKMSLGAQRWFDEHAACSGSIDLGSKRSPTFDANDNRRRWRRRSSEPQAVRWQWSPIGADSRKT